MATHKSAEKRARQATRRQTRNSMVKNSVKTFEKNLVKALESKAKEVPELLKTFMSEMDKAAQKGVVSRLAASRKVARLSARVHKASAGK